MLFALRKSARVFLAGVGITLPLCAHSDQFRVGDNFNDNSINPANWVQETIIVASQSTNSTATHLLAEVGQRMSFVYPGRFYFGYIDSAVRWQGNYGSYTNDWVVYADLTISDGVFQNEPFGGSLDYVGLSLEISDRSRLDNLVRLRFVNHLIAQNFPPLVERWAQGMVWADGVYQGNQEAAVSGTNLTARIAWKAQQQTLFLQFDATGPADGQQWQTIRTVNVGAAGVNWQMNADSEFQFRLVADTDYYLENPVPNGVAYADNLVMISAPVITAQPQNQTALEGQNISLSVEVEPQLPMTFLWQRSGQPVPSGSSAVLGFGSVQLADAGEYQVTITNEAGSVTSIPVTLTVNPNPDLPLFQQQPQNISSYVGQSVQFSAQVQSVTPVSYQWLHSSTNLPGRTAATLSLTGLTTADAGEYRVRVTNAAGSKLSQPAQLTVATTPPPSVSFVRIGPTLIIHWPLSATGFKAWTSEYTVGPWSEYTGSYFLYQGNRTAIQANPTQGTRYFRLQK